MQEIGEASVILLLQSS